MKVYVTAKTARFKWLKNQNQTFIDLTKFVICFNIFLRISSYDQFTTRILNSCNKFIRLNNNYITGFVKNLLIVFSSQHNKLKL